MKNYILVLLLLFVNIVESVIVANSSNESVWELVSQYALGVWKYANLTITSLTVPHN